MKNIWLQGGPFLELSFVLENSSSEEERFRYILEQFTALGFQCNNENVDDLVYTKKIAAIFKPK